MASGFDQPSTSSRTGRSVPRAPGYTFRLDEAELTRFDAMARNAERHEGELWTSAGMTEGATVVDLGCGPGALTRAMAERVGASGRIIAIDADPIACATVERVAADLATPVRVVCTDAASALHGVEPACADVVMCRNVLVHNGTRVAQLLASARRLLRPGGVLLSAEPDLVGLVFEDADMERQYERRWQAMIADDGCDPALGSGDRLARLLERHGWETVAALDWTDRLVVERSPAWAAADAVVGRGFATAAEVGEWRQAMEFRRADGRLLHCSLPMAAVAAVPRA
jgi:SAM-dependent methyltransferase